MNTTIQFPYDVAYDEANGDYVLIKDTEDSLRESHGEYFEVMRFNTPTEAEEYFTENLGGFLYE